MIGGHNPDFGQPFTRLGGATVDFNSVADTALTLILPRNLTVYRAQTLIIEGANADISSASFALYTSTGGAGVAIRAITACTVSTTSGATAAGLQAIGISVDGWYATNPLYFRVTTAHGAPGTARVHFFGYPLR